MFFVSFVVKSRRYFSLLCFDLCPSVALIAATPPCDYVQSERETLQLMASDITANVRLLMSERFPKQDLRRVVNEITHMCKKVAHLGLSETLADAGGRKERIDHGVRI